MNQPLNIVFIVYGSYRFWKFMLNQLVWSIYNYANENKSRGSQQVSLVDWISLFKIWPAGHIAFSESLEKCTRKEGGMHVILFPFESSIRKQIA